MISPFSLPRKKRVNINSQQKTAVQEVTCYRNLDLAEFGFHKSSWLGWGRGAHHAKQGSLLRGADNRNTGSHLFPQTPNIRCTSAINRCCSPSKGQCCFPSNSTIMPDISERYNHLKTRTQLGGVTGLCDTVLARGHANLSTISQWATFSLTVVLKMVCLHFQLITNW